MAETRELIVGTAHDLFMEQGYRAVSTRQIAEVCGLTQPALYHHFANKQELYVEVLRTVLKRTEAALKQIADTCTRTWDRLFETARYLLASQPENSIQMFYDMQKELDPAAKQELDAEWRRTFLDPIAAMFAEGVRHGELRAVTDARNAAYLFLNMLPKFPDSGLSEPERAKQQAKLIVDVLLFGLAESRGAI
ncbi:TetR/AcrR family transcriptional regulator [Ectobacillus ponti]|uniref:TetR/AcrR family transcriptional regulator n=1 Tax=Ectobacillus ponti TaxID=2961894 RepID=A0AA41X9E4_9BACI|nr:TetR/AcrR family transcriptional regulator [Ectobacillus ponti]MCP8967801.1 TetR/AcrR family transcriptional regulator [Ectobacillus ponti]